ncbi:hypothetical protein Y032_0321g2426 [Ancylostoma ceylanicum]|nr:hypothetical protein Y032_0321g2426 [Ancylostoma ceylanicum]
MRDVLERVPQLKFLEHYGSYLAADKNDTDFIKFQAVWLCSAFTIVALCIVVAVIIIAHLHRKRHSMSLRSIELHRSLTIHLTLQILIPVLTTLIPMLILFCTRYVEVPFGAEFWNLIISQTVALHSPLNTIAILVATRHYRTVILKPFERFSSVLTGTKTHPAPSVIRIESTVLGIK